MSQPKWRPAEELTPFARLIREGYLWKQTPNLTVPQLAAMTGIAKMTIWSWLNRNAIPRRDTILVLARTTGLDVDELLAAAGLPSTRQTASERRGAERVVRLMLRHVEAKLRDDARLSPQDTDAVMAHLRTLFPSMVESAASALATPEIGETGDPALSAPAAAAGESGETGEASDEDGHKRRRAAVSVRH